MISMNGLITANGGFAGASDTGAGSGGGIYLRCKRFDGDGTGWLYAKGGGTAGSINAGNGGGGRIAVWRYQHTGFNMNNASVDQGSWGGAYTPTGEVGTIEWFDTNPSKGTIMSMR